MIVCYLIMIRLDANFFKLANQNPGLHEGKKTAASKIPKVDFKLLL